MATEIAPNAAHILYAHLSNRAQILPTWKQALLLLYERGPGEWKILVPWCVRLR
jgi:hypothetical protein